MEPPGEKVKRKSRDREPSTRWHKLEEEFSIRHPGFFKQLIKRGPDLSKREIHICAMLRDGMLSWEIGEKLSIAEMTVNNHRSSIRTKLKLSREADLFTFLLKL